MIPAALLAVATWCAALVHATSCLGLRPAMGWPASIVAFVGGGALLRRRRRRAAAAVAGAASTTPSPARRVDRRDVFGGLAALAIVAVFSARPFVDAIESAPSAHDAVYIWTPKTVKGLVEAPPRMPERSLKPGETALEYHAEYPRLLPQIGAALGAASNPPDARGLKLAALSICVLGLLAAYGAAAARGNRAGGLAAIVAIAALPTFARHMSDGYADSVVAIFVLLSAIGLGRDAEGRIRPWIALAGGLGAATTKDEGVVVFLATGALVLFDAARTRRASGFVAALAAAALYAPWAAVKRAAPSRGFLLLESARENAGMVWLRAEAAAAEIAHVAFGLEDPSPGGPVYSNLRDGATWAAVAIATAIVLLLRSRAFDAKPALVALVGVFAAFAVTPDALDWHVETAATRLASHVAPALLLAAIFATTEGRRRVEDSPAATGVDPVTSPA